MKERFRSRELGMCRQEGEIGAVADLGGARGALAGGGEMVSAQYLRGARRGGGNLLAGRPKILGEG